MRPGSPRRRRHLSKVLLVALLAAASLPNQGCAPLMMLMQAASSIAQIGGGILGLSRLFGSGSTSSRRPVPSTSRSTQTSRSRPTTVSQDGRNSTAGGARAQATVRGGATGAIRDVARRQSGAGTIYGLPGGGDQ